MTRNLATSLLFVGTLCAGSGAAPGSQAFRQLENGTRSEDFLSVTHAGARSCLLLDATGALFFSPDGGSTLVHRARHPDIGLVQIRFTGLLKGWGIDRQGRLWHTRDGGRTFQAQPLPGGRFARRLVRPATAADTILLRDVAGALHQLSGRTHGEIPENEIHPLPSSLGTNLVLVLDEGCARVNHPGAEKEWRVVDERGWNDAASTNLGVVLVGDDGRVARVGRGPAGKLEVVDLHAARPDVTDVAIFDQVHLWVAYADGTLCASSDGGQSFEELGRHQPDGPVRLAFVSVRKGFMLAGPHRLLATTDGGQSWTERANWPDLHLHDLFFLDDRRGWLVGGQGSVLHTSDGGTSWTSTRLAPGHDLHQVRFVNARLGWTAGAGGAVYRSQDGGRSWTQVLAGQGTLLSMYFTRSGHGWVGGENGVLLHTTDGGDHWTPRSVAVAGPFRSMSFVDSARGLAADGRGTLAVTKDGGHSWQPVSIATDRLPTVVACNPRTARCLVGGQSGLLLAGNPFRYLP